VESPTELEQQILFGLSTLGQRNAHHEFEQLCLGLARRRITSNLMPATGPVSAGGDQSRDGESFWSNLSSELPGTSVFVAMVATEKVVLACTIRQGDVAGKIKADIAALGAQNEVDRVSYFITGPLPVGKRHDLIAEALTNHRIKLDIWDCNAISDHLKEHDLFYLAVTFLHLHRISPPPRRTVMHLYPSGTSRIGSAGAVAPHQLSQETSTSVPELRGLLLTPADAAWIDWVSAAGDSLGAQGIPAIAINSRVGRDLNTSGALYAFNHSGYANPWLGIVWPAAFNSLRLACTTNPPSDLFVLQPGTSTEHAPSTVGVAKNLAACGINFPGDFRVVDKRVSSDLAFGLTIWRLKSGGPHP